MDKTFKITVIYGMICTALSCICICKAGYNMLDRIGSLEEQTRQLAKNQAKWAERYVDTYKTTNKEIEDLYRKVIDLYKRTK